MRRMFGKTLISITVITILMCVVSLSYASGSTGILLRNSKIIQSPVVNVGEDLGMEVVLEDVPVDTYQWYFNNTPIANANQKIYNIVDASVEDSGLYRVEAFDANGKMLVSMDVNARVIDPTVPKSGDRSMPVEIAGGILLMSCAALFMFCRRKAN